MRQDLSNGEIHGNVFGSSTTSYEGYSVRTVHGGASGWTPNQLVLKREEGEFRMAYVGLAERWDMGELEGKPEDFRRERKREEEWTCSMMFGPEGNGTVYEIGEARLAEELAELVGSPLEGRVHSHELSGTDSSDLFPRTIYSNSTSLNHMVTK